MSLTSTVGKTAPSFERIVTVSVVMYMHLWMLEGAIRKWVPGSELVMYVARDALVLASVVVLGLGSARRVRSAPAFWVFTLGLVLLASVQVLLGRVSLPIAAVGVRSYLAPFLLVYLVWCYPVLNLWRRIVTILAAYAPVEATLAVAQVMSPARSPINKQVGSDAAYFLNDGIVRASGTFSAPSGFSLYVPIALAAALFLISDSPKKSRWLWILSLVCVIGISAVSGSRGAVLAATIVLAGFLLYHLIRASHGGLRNVLFTIVAGALCLVAIQAWLPEVVNSFLNRFENASRSEDVTGRITDQTFDFFGAPFSIFGDGAGTHSMAGINLGSMGPWIEIESTKWVAELGLVGWFMACARLIFCFSIACIIFGRLSKSGPLALLTASAMIPVIAFGQITHYPTAQGFLAICLAILVAVQPSGQQYGRTYGAGLDSNTFSGRTISLRQYGRKT